MPNTTDRVGWIGTGRMGYAMVERLLDAKVPVSVWNRTRSKAEPLQAKGAVIVDKAFDLAGFDIVFCIVAKAADLEAVCFGENGLMGGSKHPSILVDCSTIGLDDSAAIRERLAAKGVAFIAAPVSGNGKVVQAGLLSAILSGPEAACKRVTPYMQQIAARGVSYAGEADLARVCKIAHNLMLGVVTQALCEATLLAQKAGVPRHAFLDFLNNSVMGSMFTRYKSSALVNLDWTPTFTATLLRKDLDLGLGMARSLDLPMPITAATREMIQAHLGTVNAELDFAALLETLAGFSGVKLVSENKVVPTGLETPADAAAKR
ncbi:MAG: NAD(P)-dependent oxidoreductase [Steroidobacteraceae bacterium]